MSYKHERVHAYRPAETLGHLTPCEADDPEATHFEVRYPNAYGLTLDFECGYKAYQVARALDAAVAHGRDAQMADLRRFLGVRER